MEIAVVWSQKCLAPLYSFKFTFIQLYSFAQRVLPKPSQEDYDEYERLIGQRKSCLYMVFAFSDFMKTYFHNIRSLPSY